MQNVILYLFKSRDKLNTLTEVLSVETANRRERHPGDSPQATDFENKKSVQKESCGFCWGGLERYRNFSYTEKKILRKSRGVISLNQRKREETYGRKAKTKI